MVWQRFLRAGADSRVGDVLHLRQDTCPDVGTSASQQSRAEMMGGKYLRTSSLKRDRSDVLNRYLGTYCLV